MRLLTKTTLYYILLSIPVFFIAGIACYYIITSEIKRNDDELLRSRLVQIEKYLDSNDSISIQLILKSGEAKVQLLNAVNTTYQLFADTLIYDTSEKEMAPFRAIKALYKTNNKEYSILIIRPAIEYKDLLSGIIVGVLILLLFCLAAFFIINWFVSKLLWSSFYDSLKQIQNFNLNSKNKLTLKSSTVQEFAELNDAFQKLADRTIADYKNQKQFTENASHEMQTPLAIIQAQLDLLIQSKNLQEQEMKHLSVMNNGINRLRKLNKTLLLLSKIENLQFEASSTVSLNNILNNVLSFYDDFIHAKNLKIHLQFLTQKYLLINTDICEILISNLLQNAIRHNYDNGKIFIELNNEFLKISNTSNLPQHDTEFIFKRFSKDSHDEYSIGLGLALVKQISVTNDLKIDYDYSNGMHNFYLRF